MTIKVRTFLSHNLPVQLWLTTYVNDTGYADLSQMTSIDQTHSFSTEFAIDPGMSGKVRESEVGFSHDDDGDSSNSDDIVQPSKKSLGQNGTRHEIRSTKVTADLPDEEMYQSYQKPTVEDSQLLQPSTRSNAPKKSPRKTSQRTKSRTRQNARQKAVHAEDKENDASRHEYKDDSHRGEKEYEAYEASEDEQEDIARLGRRKVPGLRRPTEIYQLGHNPIPLSTPKFTQWWDWLFFQWHSGLGDKMKMFWQISCCLFTAFVAWQVATHPSVRSAFSDTSQSVRDSWPGVPWPTGRTPQEAPRDWQEVSDRLFRLEKTVSSGNKKMSADFEKEKNELWASIRTLHRDIIDGVGSEKTAKGMKQLENQLKTNEHRFKGIQDLYSRLENKVNQVGDSRESVAALRKEFEEVLKARLPKELLGYMKSDGSVEFPPEFKNYLRDTFQSFFPDGVNQQPNPAASWEVFMNSNSDRLRVTVDEQVKAAVAKATKDTPEIALTPASVLQLIQPDLDAMQQTWERDHASLKQSLESSQAKGMSDIAKRAAAVATAAARQAASSLTPGTPQSAGSDRPDFANQLNGARPWPYLTSPSYVFPHSQRRSTHPATALLPSFDSGDCWPFPGSQGTLAIKLSEPVFPTDVVVEHGFKSASPDLTSTPKRFHFWARVLDPVQRMALHQAVLKAQGETDTAKPMPILLDGRADAGKYTDFVKVHEFTYELDGPENQTFELPVDFAQLGIMPQVVAVVMSENYGNEDHSCLYRVRLHGHNRNSVPEEYRTGLKQEAERKKQEAAAKKGWFSW